jgi:hypothetical protein
MFDFDYRSVIINSFIMGCILVILFFGVFLSGCAVSGCGNPVVHNDVDSNDYINEQNDIKVEAPERIPLRQKHKISHRKISSKYSRNF